jgi:hypothetical protein
MRENNAILILDACQEGILRAIGYNHLDLPKDSGIFAGDSGYSFKVRATFPFSRPTRLEAKRKS